MEGDVQTVDKIRLRSIFGLIGVGDLFILQLNGLDYCHLHFYIVRIRN